MHIALVVGILVNLLRALRLPRGWCGVVVLPAIWFYTAATGWQPSAVRSTLMMSVVLAGWSLHRPQDLVNSLAAAALGLLAWQPSQLFQSGFQLSFAVVLAIALFQPHFETWLSRCVAPDPLIPKLPKPRWRERLDGAVAWVVTSLAVSLAAWLGSVVLIASCFHLFTPVGLLANLLVVPLSGMALMCNLGALCCGAWLPQLTALFNHSAWLWMKALIVISETAASLPGAWWHVRSPTPLEIVLFHGVLAWFLVRHKLARRVRVAAAAVLLIGGAVWLAQAMRREKPACITVLPAGSGAAVYCGPGVAGADMLIDCGDAQTMRFVVMPFLQSRGVNTLETMVLTHGDQRHVEGTGGILREFKVAEAWTPSSPSRSKAYREALNRLEKGKVKVVSASRGVTIGPWRVLHPSAGDRFPQADDNALVLAGRIEGMTVLLLSDLGRRGQAALLEREPDLTADIVVAGIPSEGGALAEEFVAQLRPRVIVLNAGEFPTSQQPRPELITRLRRQGAEVFSTWSEGAVMLEFAEPGCRVKSMSGLECRVSRRREGDVGQARGRGFTGWGRGRERWPAFAEGRGP